MQHHACETFETREQWLEARRGGVGASEAPAILGLSPWTSPYALWADKTGVIVAPDQETEWMRWGLALEEPIAREYEARTGRIVKPLPAPHCLYWRTDAGYEWQCCTPDRWITDPNRGGALGVLEIKTTAAWNDSEWEEGPPLMYQVQLQHQLMVLGLQWGSLAVLVGGSKFRYWDFERHEPTIQMLEERERMFWELVVTETPPPVDGHDATERILKALFTPREGAAPVDLPAAALEWDGRLRELREELARMRAQMRKLEDEKRELENQIRQALGDAEVGVLPSGAAYRHTVVHNPGYIKAPYSYTLLRRVDSPAETAAKEAAKKERAAAKRAVGVA